MGIPRDVFGPRLCYLSLLLLLPHARRHSMHVRHLNFCLAVFSAVFYFSLMNGHFQCGAPSCGRSFESSGALLRHCPSCLPYWQQAATQANFQCKHLQSNTGRESVAFKKPKLLQENVRESVILTWSHLKDNRTMIRQNPIHPVPSQLCCCEATLDNLGCLTTKPTRRRAVEWTDDRQVVEECRGAPLVGINLRTRAMGQSEINWGTTDYYRGYLYWLGY